LETGVTCTVESNAGIHLIPADLASWKQRPARPLTIGGKEISRLIIEERRRLRGMDAARAAGLQVVAL